MSKFKCFRLNVCIDYHEGLNPINYREPLHDMLRLFAWQHKLEYAAIFDRHETDGFDSCEQPPEGCKSDMVYFRSTAQTRIEAKDLRKLIDDTFGKSLSVVSDGVDLYYMLQKHLCKYPFPKEYIRYLNYPYMEVHKDGQSSVHIPLSVLSDCLADEVDCRQN